MSSGTDCNVLVCGLGPVGQLLSLLLGGRGVSVIAIDKADEPYDLPRAAVVDDEVLRIFQAAGVIQDVLRETQVQEEVSFVPDGGSPLTILRPVDGSQGQPPLVSIHQPSLERTLIAAATAQDCVDMRRGRRLVRLLEAPNGVEALVERREDRELETITSRWAIGCDGAGSSVRQLLGIEFGGSTFRQRWLVVDAKVDRPLTNVGHPYFLGDPSRPIVSLPMSPGRHRWEWMLHPGEDEEPFLDPESIRERMEPFVVDEEVTVERACVYTFHSRVASRWREGRTLLAGDAAHLMPPFAGQGFSSGARDAANLAWKLQAVVGGAPEALLDTYEIERRPHVMAMSRLAVALGKFVQTTDPRVAVLRDAFLAALDRTGGLAWLRDRLKPLPAYCGGAFAERPKRLSFMRSVGSQFPQPLVRTPGGEEVLLDDLTGPGWSAIALDEEPAHLLAEAHLQALLLGRDFEDPERVIDRWLSGNGASWVILRPDRFTFALGSGMDDAHRALDQLHRVLGRAAFRPVAARPAAEVVA